MLEYLFWTLIVGLALAMFIARNLDARAAEAAEDREAAAHRARVARPLLGAAAILRAARESGDVRGYLAERSADPVERAKYASWRAGTRLNRVRPVL